MLTLIHEASAPGGHHGALERVAALTAALLAASDAQEWSQVSELEAQRFALLKSLPAITFQADEAAAQRILAEALRSTEVITARIRDVLSSEQRELGKLCKGRNAALSYLQNSASPGVL